MSILILVPQGSEYRTVQRGLRNSRVQILAIPAGSAVCDFLETLEWDWRSVSQVLVMGLCGGLNPTTKPGQIGWYESCHLHNGKSFPCSALGMPIDSESLQQIARWDGLTIDHVVTNTQAKQALYSQTQCDVVDMESGWIVGFMRRQGIETVVLRVVSDGVRGDLPDLSEAFNAAGEIQPWALFQAFVRQPIAALRLIHGSLTALWRLEACTAMLWKSFTV
jgi:Phosphorylase superfamily